MSPQIARAPAAQLALPAAAPPDAAAAVPPVVSHTHALVLEHLPLIRTIARRLAKRLPPSVEVDELVNVGVLGLLGARDRFDASRGVPFKAYAELRIKGQMIDALRADDLVPRSVRRKHTRLEQERAVLRDRLGRTPTRDELRHQLDLEPGKFDAFIRDALIAPISSLDATATDDGSPPLVECLSHAAPTAEERFSDAQVRRAVAAAVAHLPDKERYAVTEYYLRHRTLKSIGADLEVTESRACQLRGQGVRRLQYRLRHLMP